MSEEKSVDLRFLEKLRSKLAEHGRSNHDDLDQNNVDVCDTIIPESDKKRKLDNCVKAIISQEIWETGSAALTSSKKKPDLGKKVPGKTKILCNKKVKLHENSKTDLKKSETETLSEMDYSLFDSSRTLVDLEDQVEASSLGVKENGITSPKSRKLTGTYLGLANMQPTSVRRPSYWISFQRFLSFFRP